jgi:DNA-binding response OmpR family regulator
MKILFMEDDEILNEVVSNFLKNENYEVYSVFDGQEAKELIYDETFDLLLLDVNVPEINGFDLLEELRTKNIMIPCIFITSLNNKEDLQDGFASGCDDYIKKPFEFEELVLRINNIKRLYKIETQDIIRIKEKISYDFSKKHIINDSTIHSLSKKEIEIFEYLIKNKNKVINIDEFGLNLWPYVEKPSGSTIRTYIKNFRRMTSNDCITTITGLGYRFN